MIVSLGVVNFKISFAQVKEIDRVNKLMLLVVNSSESFTEQKRKEYTWNIFSEYEIRLTYKKIITFGCVNGIFVNFTIPNWMKFITQLKSETDRLFSKLPKWFCLKGSKGAIPFNCVYIGREFKKGYYNLEASKYQNPFKLRDYNGCIEKVCLLFRDYFVRDCVKIIEDLEELDGKMLGCFCELTNNCHGDEIIKIRRDQLENSVIIIMDVEMHLN